MAIRTTEQVTNTIKNYYSLLLRAGFPIKKIILFGSYSSGKQAENSDIDIAVVLKKFTDDKFSTRLQLMKFCRGFDEVIEPHPFLEKDFNNSNPFVSEIIKNGVVLYS